MITDRETLEKALQHYLVATLGLPEEIGVDDELVERGFIASAQLIDIIGFVEDEFHVVLRAVDVVPERLVSIRAMADMVLNRMASMKG